MNNNNFLEKLRAKDVVAWQEAYERYYPKTEMFLKSIRYPPDDLKEDARDIWQETVTILYLNLVQGKKIEDLGGYVFGIIRKKGLKKFNEKTKKNEIIDNNWLSVENDHERIKTTHEIAVDVLKDMDGKKGFKHCAEIIRMFFLERKKDREIAKKTGLKEDYIRVRRNKICLPYFRKAFMKHYKFPDLNE